MDLTMIDPIWWIVLGVLVVVLVGLLVWSARRRAHRTKRLKDQFRSEYDRTASSSSRKEAEEDLERRSVRRRRVNLVDLEDSDAESLRQHLDDLLRSFVDGPQGAALGMEQLIDRVAGARGYVASEGSVLDLVSVDHPEQVAAMRRSRTEMDEATGTGLTEASRQTFLDARVLAVRLLAEGRAGGFEEGVPEPRPRSEHPQTDIAADVTDPAPAHEQPPVLESDRDTDDRATSEPKATDGPQAETTEDGSPRR